MRPRLAAALAFALAGCDHGAPTKQNQTGPIVPCSELARFFYGANGSNVNDLCGPDAPKRRELFPLGAGNLLEWLPQRRIYRLWNVGGDPLLPAVAPPPILASNEEGFGRILIALGGNRILEVNALATKARVFEVTFDPGQILGQPNELQFAGNFWGHEMIALDDDYLLRWIPGDGSYVILRFDRAHWDKGNPFTVDNQFGGQIADFRRGARLVNLGHGQLLTWVPGAPTYQIRRYHFDAVPDLARDAATDIFDAPTEHPWEPLQPEQQLLVVDEGLMLLWDTSDGTLQLRRFDTGADDPLAPDGLPVSPLAQHTYGSELQSADPPAPTTSKAIQHLVVLLQRGRSFDSLFGQYCTGTTPVQPDCQGAACCERMPDRIPGADSCAPIDATDPNAHVPDDGNVCLEAKIDGVRNDHYADAVIPNESCGDPRDFACAGSGAQAGAIGGYHALAATGALADQFFQSDLLGYESNAVYLAKAGFAVSPADVTGQLLPAQLASRYVRVAFYQEDPFSIPLPKTDGGENLPPPNFYDAHWTFFRFPEEIDRDIEMRQLGAISTVFLPPPYSGSPRDGALKDGVDRVTSLVNKLMATDPYRSDTLIVVAFLTSGGYYDHAPVPPAYPEHGQSVDYGPRVPLLILGPFARSNYVSHVQVELSSLVAFAEWNWMGGAVGQLEERDATVATISDLLDPTTLDVPVPLHSQTIQPR